MDTYIDYTDYFPNVYTANWSEEVLVIKKVKDTVLWTKRYYQCNLKNEGIIGTFYEKELQKASQKEFRDLKVIQRKADRLYVQWKGFDNSFSIRVHMKDVV